MTQSTCEAELLAYNEAYQVGEAMSALFTTLGMKAELFGDSKSALSLCTGQTGHWRTRHLRLRASKLREGIRETKSWTATHREGLSLVSDGLTKPLQGQAFSRFVDKLGMGSIEAMRTTEKGVEREERRAASPGHTATVLALIAGCLAATGQYGWGAAAAVGAVAATVRARRRGSAQALLAQKGDGHPLAQDEGLDQVQEGHGQVHERVFVRSLRPDDREAGGGMFSYEGRSAQGVNILPGRVWRQR